MENTKTLLSNKWVKIPLSTLITLLGLGGVGAGIKHLSSAEVVEAKVENVHIYRLGKIEEKQKFLDEQIYQALNQMKTDIALMQKDIEYLKKQKQ